MWKISGFVPTPTLTKTIKVNRKKREISVWKINEQVDNYNSLFLINFQICILAEFMSKMCYNMIYIQDYFLKNQIDESLRIGFNFLYVFWAV